MASSDGGLSAPSTAPTFAAGSAISGGSDASAARAAPEPLQQNGAVDLLGIEDVPATAAGGEGGDASAAGGGFAGITTFEWGQWGQQQLEERNPKSPRAAHGRAPPDASEEVVVARYRKISPRAVPDPEELLPARRLPRASRSPAGSVGHGGPRLNPFAQGTGGLFVRPDRPGSVKRAIDGVLVGALQRQVPRED